MPALQDLRYAVRMMLKSPGVTLLAVLSLALGIGANTTIFTVVNAILLRPFPFPQPERLISIHGVNPQRAQVTTISTYDVQDWAKASKTIESFGVWRNGHFDLTFNGKAESAPSLICSAGLFEVLGIKPAAGRFFTADEDQPGRNHVVVLSYGFWQSHFGGELSAIGGTLRLNEEPYTIIGVLPRDFELPDIDWYKYWAPNSNDEDLYKGRHLRNRTVYARLKPGASLQQARSEIEALAAGTARQYPDIDTGWSARVESLTEEQVGETRRPLAILFGAVAMVLLIACVNVVNLLLTRVVTRRGELAVRMALGSSVTRLARLLVTETLLLCAVGGVIGVLVAAWSLKALIALAPKATPRIELVSMDATTIAFAVAISLLIGVIVGVVPAWRAGKLNVEATLKESGSQRSGSRSFRAGAMLARAEIALAMVLLIGAALLAQSFLRMLAVPTDFRSDGVLMVQVFPPYPKYRPLPQLLDVYSRFGDELRTLPGVQSVAQGSNPPYHTDSGESDEFAPAEQPTGTGARFPEARYYNISPGYFATLGIPLLRGRDFSSSDTQTSTPVVIVNDSLARRTWPDQDPIGKQLRLIHAGKVYEVVGVTGNVRQFPSQMEPSPEMYFVYPQYPRWASVFIIRTSGDPAALSRAVRDRISAVEPNTTMGQVRTMHEAMMRPLLRPRFNMTLMIIFAVLATVLAVIGVYGVISFSTAQRTREIGVRIALGASRGSVMRLVLGAGFRMVLVGIAAGTIAALASTRIIRTLLYGIAPNDPLTLTAVPMLLAIITLVACYFPARRATKVDPIEALRTE